MVINIWFFYLFLFLYLHISILDTFSSFSILGFTTSRGQFRNNIHLRFVEDSRRKAAKSIRIFVWSEMTKNWLVSYKPKTFKDHGVSYKDNNTRKWIAWMCNHIHITRRLNILIACVNSLPWCCYFFTRFIYIHVPAPQTYTTRGSQWWMYVAIWGSQMNMEMVHIAHIGIKLRSFHLNTPFHILLLFIPHAQEIETLL